MSEACTWARRRRAGWITRTHVDVAPQPYLELDQAGRPFECHRFVGLQLSLDEARATDAGAMGCQDRQGRKGALVPLIEVDLRHQQGQRERMEVGNHLQGYGYQRADLALQRADIVPGDVHVTLLVLVVKLRLTGDAGCGVGDLRVLARKLEVVRLSRLVIYCGHASYLVSERLLCRASGRCR